MLRKVLIAAVVALVPVAPANGQSQRVLLMPGVSYSRQVEFTTHGPVALHVINAPRPTGLYGLKPVLSNEAIVGRERVTAMQRRVSPTATVAGVNGDLFAFADGRPSGILMRSGVLDSAPLANRSSVGIAADGSLRVERVAYAGIWRGTGQRRPLRLNQPPTPNGVALYTPTFGRTTPTGTSVVEAVVMPFPQTEPNTDLNGTIVSLGQTAGGTPIPRGGAVLVARGTGAARVAEEAPVGTSLFVRLVLTPSWAGVVDALGGGPALVRNGRPVFHANEGFSVSQLAPRHPRTAVGQLADGRIVLVAVDGRQPGYSVGMTNFELALAMVRLGAVTASALDGGGSTTMAFEGALLNRPSDRAGERPVAEALLVFYYGVYASPPAETVVSPNGDGVAEGQELAYKVVRSSHVAATLVAPDGSVRTLDEGVKPPGVHRLEWNARRRDGTLEPEGRWRFSVTAVDDRAETSSTDRIFWLNLTLGSLQAQRTVRIGRSGSNLRARFRLARAARVVVTVERPSGAVVRTILSRQVREGAWSAGWNGRDNSGFLALPGRYVIRVRAANGLGTVDLTRPFSVRRL